MKPTIAFVIALYAVLACRASAHAFLDHAEPEVGAKLTRPPSEIRIWFTADVVAPSLIEVFDSDEHRVDKKDTHIDAKDNTLLIVSLKKLPAGVYKVTWHAVTHDTHKTHGDFTFMIKADSP